jgi:hypothetical protein
MKFFNLNNNNLKCKIYYKINNVIIKIIKWDRESPIVHNINNSY